LFLSPNPLSPLLSHPLSSFIPPPPSLVPTQYYAAKSSGIKVPKWMAMVVTSIQTSQMFLGVMVSLFVLKLKLLNGQR
jgi:hypothetical protein